MIVVLDVSTGAEIVLQREYAEQSGDIVRQANCVIAPTLFILMGMSSQTRILTICHCERSSDVIRIISARKADKSERKQYEGYYHA